MPPGPACQVDAYRTPQGDCPVQTFIESLSDRDQADALVAVKLLEARGHQLREPHSKAIEPGLWELRRGQVRIAFTFRPGRRAILLDGWLKKTDRIPRQLLDRARALRDAVAQAEGRTR
jgi:hypothetical protein